MKSSKFVMVMAVMASLLICGNASAGPIEDRVTALEATVVALQAQIDALKASPAVQMGDLGYLKLVTTDLNYLKGPHVIFEGVNVHVRDGSGVTEGDQTGYGNFIIGYNELNPDYELFGEYPTPADRSGTHNLVIGAEHRYRSTGNILHGWKCLAAAGYGFNVGLATSSTKFNGDYGSSLTGLGHILSWNSAIIGGRDNVATANEGVILGGSNNTLGSSGVIAGGEYNTVTGGGAVITGGAYNTASGLRSTVSGGNSITVNTDDGWGAPGH